MKHLIIHHDADYDGLLSNEVCRFAIQKCGSLPESIGWDYGKPIPNRDWSLYERVYMVDISIDPLMDKIPNLIWIDHHKTAIDKFNPKLPGYRIDGVAACRLCWQWFSHDVAVHTMSDPAYLPSKEDYVERRVSEPLLIRLAGEHDIWDHRDDRSLILQSGLRELEPAEWNSLIQEEFGICERGQLSKLDQCLAIGERSKKSRDRANAATMKKRAHTILWKGLRFLCCNGVSSSQAFESAVRPEHDALFAWVYDGQTKKATVSLYHATGKEEHDLSVIAKEMGGGGHKGACGFPTTLDNLAFILEEVP